MKFYTYVTKTNGKVYERFVENGERKERVCDLIPDLFIESKEPTGIKSLCGKNLKPVQVDDYKHWLDKKDQYKKGGYRCYGYEPAEYSFISDHYDLETSYNADEILVFSLDIETEVPDNGFPDPKNAECPINVVTIHHSIKDKYFVFTWQDFEVTADVDNISPDHIIKKVYENERGMLLGLLKFWNEERPDVLSGWFTSGFDAQYLYNRTKRLGIMFGKKKGCDAFSLFGRTLEKKDGSVEFRGISHLDFQLVMKKFNAGERSWTLNSVADDYLGVKKVENPYTNFKDFYTKEWDLFVTYNIRDVELVVRLMRKTRLLDLIYTLAYLTGANYEDVFGTLKIWEVYIQNVLKKEGVYLEMNRDVPDVDGSIMGGFVLDPKAGKYEWLVSFDQNSLYPSIIRSWNISPETIIDEPPDELLKYSGRIFQKLPKELPALLKKYGLAMTMNGQFFRTDFKGVIPRMCGHVYDQRVETKNQMKALKKANYEKGIKDDPQLYILNHKQHALKILLNSLYGALCHRFFAFFDFRCAEGITSTGQYIIKRIGENVGSEIDKVSGVADSLIYSDTDSCIFSLKSVIEKLSEKKDIKFSAELIDMIDNFCQGFIVPRIDKENAAIGNDLNAPFNCLAMKREKICESGFWAAKKRYAVKIWDDEGLRLTEPKYSITGLEIKRSSTPKFAQEKLMSLVKLLLSDDFKNARKVLDGFKKDYMNGDLLEIGLPIGINSMPTEKDYCIALNAGKKLTIPQHIKGALVFNEFIRILGLNGTYKKLGNGDKVFKYLLKVNPIQKLFTNADELDVRLDGLKVDVISVPQELESLEIFKYFRDFIDRERMFNIALGEAAERMLEACGVKKETNTLDFLF